MSNASDPAALRDAVFEQVAQVAQALAAPARLRMLGLLANGEKSVDELAAKTGQSLALASAHLKVLRACHLVESRREGRRVLCRLAGDDVAALWLSLRGVAEAHVPQVRELVKQVRDGQVLARLEASEVVRLASTGAIVLLDLRPPDEFAAGHLPGARAVPFAELKARMAGLPRDRQLVAYCRGPYCVLANEGVALLRSHGLDATHLAEGVAEWRARGQALAFGVS